MKRIIYIPLDERPCNYDFPFKIFNDDNTKIIRPPYNLLGHKKEPAPLKELLVWLKEAVKGADGLVVSLDMLIYGGLVPSRLHHSKKETLLKGLNILKEIKKEDPKLPIYGFQLIMRCPGYNSSDEEPDYYETYGKNIFAEGVLRHKRALNEISEETYQKEKQDIPEVFLEDYLKRRETNKEIIDSTLELVKENIIDFLVIPQDDSAPYGFTATDQEFVRENIDNDKLFDRVYMYPGADEVGSTLISRVILKLYNKTPKVYIKYPSVTSPWIYPNIEDRYLDVTVKYQIIVSGGVVVTSLEESDIVLFINAPADRMLSSLLPKKEGVGMSVLRNMPEAFTFLSYARRLGKKIIIGDITYGNGSHINIYQWLSLKNLLFKVAAFAGWNTASNAIGSAISHGFKFYLTGKTKAHMSYLLTRYIEDIAYMGYVRQHIKNDILPKFPKFSYHDVLDKKGEFSALVLEELEKFIQKQMPELIGKYKITELYMPWKRMYEIGLTVDFIGDL